MNYRLSRTSARLLQDVRCAQSEFRQKKHYWMYNDYHRFMTDDECLGLFINVHSTHISILGLLTWNELSKQKPLNANTLFPVVDSEFKSEVKGTTTAKWLSVQRIIDDYITLWPELNDGRTTVYYKTLVVITSNILLEYPRIN
jgi:hypothetical protein